MHNNCGFGLLALQVNVQAVMDICDARNVGSVHRFKDV